MTTVDPRYSLAYRGTRLDVQLGTTGRTNTAALLVDGRQVADHEAQLWEKAELETEDLKVHVTWWWYGRPRSVLLLDEVGPPDAAEDAAAYTDRIRFDPPPGTPAARRARLEREHPRLYAARHVVLVLLKLAASVIGVSLAVSFLIRWINWSWLPTISFDWLPDWSLWGWLPDWSLWDWLPDLSMPDWLAWLLEPPVSEWLRWVVAVVVAIGVAFREVRRRRRRDERLAAPPTTSPPPTSPPPTNPPPTNPPSTNPPSTNPPSTGEVPCEPSTPPSTPPADDTSARRQQFASPATGSREPPQPRSAPPQE